PPELIVTDVIATHSQLRPNKTAVISGAERLTWAQFNARVDKVANALLRRGLKKGDKVCLLLQNSIAMLEAMIGTVRAGGVTVPLNVMMAQDSLAKMIGNAEARFVIANPETRGQIDAIRDQLGRVPVENFFTVGEADDGWGSYDAWIDAAPADDPEVALSFADTFSIVYSSGTTGVPKGMEHSHFARLMYPLCVGKELKVDRESVTCLTTPLYTNGSFLTMLPTLHFGGTLVLMEKFDAAEFLQLVERERCSNVFMVPTQCILVMAVEDFAEFDTSSLDRILVSGSPLARHTFDELRAKFPHAEIFEMYGMSEAFMTCIGPPDYEKGKIGSVGQAIYGADIRIIDDDGNELAQGETGEVVGRSAALMKGYYNDTERTEELLWREPGTGLAFMCSGDIGRFDADGYLYVVGRKKDMIISGGVNVFATDIEEVFIKHADVSEVAAIGVPHEKWGETPILLAILNEGATVSEAELMAWGNAELGRFQRVSAVEFRDAFPRNALDKILKRELRAPYWEGRERDIA
ncbi:MAG: AMP-binding protein, partial [Alphaproteobacteria bacterium]|nr:AMP-binding protein [Alphaproteobacteria bacterium]